MMDKIAVETEKSLPDGTQKFFDYKAGSLSVTESVAEAVCRMAYEVKAKAILCHTSSGGTAKLVSKYRPTTPIIAVTSEEISYRQLAFFWGVKPLIISPASKTEEMLINLIDTVIEMGIAQEVEKVVITSGILVGKPGTISSIEVHTIGEAISA